MDFKFWNGRQIDLALTIYIIAFVNALIFVLLVSDPLLTQDAWYFLDVFVRHAYDGTLGIDDFYVQRAGLDQLPDPRARQQGHADAAAAAPDQFIGEILVDARAGRCRIQEAVFMQRQGHRSAAVRTLRRVAGARPHRHYRENPERAQQTHRQQQIGK